VKKAQQQYKGAEERLAELYALLETLDSAG